MEKEKQSTDYSNGNHDCCFKFCNDYGEDCKILDRVEGYRETSSPMSCAAKLLPVTSSSLSSSSPSLSSFSPSIGFIEHPVSKLDTLAGVAIKYGVEVADIKKMNGLVTDHQMFALKSLQIPLPGRHPPSHCLSNGPIAPGQSSSDQFSSPLVHCDLFNSFQSLKPKSSRWDVSPAMGSLRGYYGLKLVDKRTLHEDFEMGMYKKGAHYLEDGPFRTPFPTSNLPLSHHRKSRSLVNAVLDENGLLTDHILLAEVGESKADKCKEKLVTDHFLLAEVGEGTVDKCKEKLVRRRQKSEADFTCTPEMMLKEDNSGGGGFSAITGKGLALRSKAASRTTLAADSEAGCLSSIPMGVTDAIVADALFGVRKSSSTSSLQDQENSNYLANRPTWRRNVKPDLQATSTATMTRPIFDGLPKPISSWRNKAALD